LKGYTLKNETNIIYSKKIFAIHLKIVENLKITNNIYVIKLILDHKGEIGDREYLVKWEGTAELSWIHKQNILSKKIIIKY
jgi:hypothetical protein